MINNTYGVECEKLGLMYKKYDEIENYSIYNSDGILYVRPKKNEIFKLVDEYCGDCQLWFVVILCNNKEVERINLKYIMSIKFSGVLDDK